MKAIILAAGFGTRLGSIGETTPKGLIGDQEGNPLLSKLLADLQAITNFKTSDDAVIITNARDYGKYADFLRAKNQDTALLSNNIMDVANSQGALNDLQFAISQKNYWNEDILVLPSDTYYEFSLNEFVNFAQSKNSLTTVVNDVRDKNLIKDRLGCATLNMEEVVTFTEKPHDPQSTLAAIPFYYYPATTLINLKNFLLEVKASSAPGAIIPWLLQKNIPVFAYQAKGKYLDVGTIAEVNKLKEIS